MEEKGKSNGESRRMENGQQRKTGGARKPSGDSPARRATTGRPAGQKRDADGKLLVSASRPAHSGAQKRDGAGKARSYEGKAGAGGIPRSFPANRAAGGQPRNEGKKPGGPAGPRKSAGAPGRVQHPARAQAASGMAAVSADELKVGDTIVVTIKRLGINGEGVGFYKRKTVFVAGALPDEIVKAKVTSQQPTMVEAVTMQIEKASPFRKKPECPVYDSCGGCQLQHMSYEGQLKAKEELVREAFERYAEGVQADIRPIAGMDSPWGYRNKAQLQVGLKGRTLITGLYSAGSHQLVDISGCPIQHPEVNRVIDEARGIIERLGIRIYNEKEKSGTIRTLVARVAAATGKAQLTLVTATDSLPLRDRLIKQIRGALPNVVTIAQNVNSGKASVVFGSTTRILWGREQLEETLGDIKLSLSPRAFFQLNPGQTVKLYDYVREAAALSGTELVVDAYCGTGTIGLWLAPNAREVRGIESIKEAAADARRNAEQSGLGNARFFEGRAEALLPQWVREGLRPDVIVVDPPRTGCDPALLGAIADAKPPRLVYVSCNPSTLAKDVKTLADAGYRIEWVQPVDMFPQTSQVECCSLLVRQN